MLDHLNIKEHKDPFFGIDFNFQFNQRLINAYIMYKNIHKLKKAAIKHKQTQ